MKAKSAIVWMVLSLTCFVLWVSNGHADTELWTLSNVTYASGTTALTGSFVYDTASAKIISSSVTAYVEQSSFSPLTFTWEPSEPPFVSPTQYTFSNPASQATVSYLGSEVVFAARVYWSNGGSPIWGGWDEYDWTVTLDFWPGSLATPPPSTVPLNLSYSSFEVDHIVYSSFTDKTYPESATASFANGSVWTAAPPASVPEPSLMVLLGISIASVFGLRRWWKD